MMKLADACRAVMHDMVENGGRAPVGIRASEEQIEAWLDEMLTRYDPNVVLPSMLMGVPLVERPGEVEIVSWRP